jgi:L-2,4-diaminobutyrate decarboxylase
VTTLISDPCSALDVSYEINEVPMNKITPLDKAAPVAAPKHEMPKEYEKHWKPDGGAHSTAPKWAKYRSEMTSEFPLPYRGGNDPLAEQIGKFVAKLDRLRPEKDGPAFLGKSGTLSFEFPDVKKVSVPERMGDLDGVLDEIVGLYEGAPNLGSPLTMCNVLPQSNTAAIMAMMLSQVFPLNTLEGEYAWNTHRAELEATGMLANLVGWNPVKTGGIFTYAGSGCWTYGLKYGLTRVLKDSRTKGVRTDAKVVVSQQAHYVKQNASDWLGLGMDNIVEIRTEVSTNEMDVVHLEEVLKDLSDKKIPVATIVCTMGTTDASAIDPIGKVRKIMDRYPNPPGCGKAVLYADAVVGWSWIFFKDYDFENNPLGFSERILPILKRNGEAMKEIVYADAIGMDFHKVGWTPWISSCFLYKNAEEFESLHMRGKDSYLQVRTPYNPMYYTLEVSRTVAGSMAAWATLKYFGKEGFQSLLGGILETKYYLYDLLKTHPDMICVNPDDTGFITLFRVYEKGVDAVTEYDAELTNKSARAALLKHNVMTKAIGDKLFEWFRAGKKINGKYTPYLSYSTGFRNTEYNIDGKDPDEVIFALKAFPMNVFVTPEIMKWTLHCVAAARDEVLKG